MVQQSIVAAALVCKGSVASCVTPNTCLQKVSERSKERRQKDDAAYTQMENEIVRQIKVDTYNPFCYTREPAFLKHHVDP